MVDKRKRLGQIIFSRQDTVIVIAVWLCLTIAGVPARALAPHRFGVGLAVGEPTGITSKYRLNNYRVLNFFLGLPVRGGEKVEVNGNYLFHWADPFQINNPDSYVHVGPGFHLSFGGEVGAGPRIPMSLNYFAFNAVEFFFEGAAGVDVLPEIRFNPDIALGFHYYF